MIVIEPFTPKPIFSNKLKKIREKIYPDVEYLKEWYANYSQKHINRLSFDFQYLVDDYPNPKNIKVLELGSVPPILTAALSEHGFDVTGFDVNPDRFKTCIKQHNLNIVTGVIGKQELVFKDNSFDVIIMNEVFEHLNTNLISVIKDLNRILKSNGKLYISTPNLKSMVGIKNFIFKSKAYSCCGEIYEEYSKIEKFGHMGHVREYTPTELKLFLKKLDFNIEKIIYRGKYPKKYRIAELLFPKLKPFFSIIAVKKT